MNVSIRLLGGFEVVLDGAPVPATAWQRRSATALVKLLALQPARRLRREQVVDALWPDLPLREAAPRLHTAAHYARAALRRRDGVVLAADGVALLPGATVRVDAAEFARAAESALTSGGEEAVAGAIELYQGDLLPDDVYEPWTADARDRHRLLHLELLRSAGRWQEVVRADPLDEEAHVHVVRDLARTGRRSAALRQLSALEDRLRHDLGVPPGTATAELREAVLALPVEETGAPAAALPSVAPVPAPTTPTLGRDRDLARVLGLLEEARIVTLLGPGGVGKTRLAIEAAGRRAELAALQACFVDLTTVSEPGRVVEPILAALGLGSGPDGSSEATLVEALRRRSLLLVLDNVEHVVEAAGLVSRLVAQAPGVQVLCTSRVRLHVAGEHIHDVAPLPVVGVQDGRVPGAPEESPAVALFARTAAAADPGFRLAAHLADVVAICRAVDGLPLAIELAAGHVRTLPPAQLRARLHARLGSPAGAGRDRPARQRTIAATIDWSLQLLAQAERLLFARMGVFAGPVPLEAIERVCGDDDGDGDTRIGPVAVVEALSRLVDHSLVQRLRGPRGEPRFRLLTLLRAHARRLLPEDTGRPVRARHAAYVAAVLDDVDERRWTDDEPWAHRIAALLPEIRPAHEDAAGRGDWPTAARITAALGTYWHREGHLTEGRRWAEEALEHQGRLDELLVARLHLAAGLVTWSRDMPRAREHWSAAAELSQRVGHRRYLAYSLALVAGSHVGNRAAAARAAALCDEAVELARRVGELPLLAAALHVRGQLALAGGDDELALRAGEEGHAVAAKAHDDAYLAMFLGDLARLALRRGDPAEARRLQQEALGVSWSRGRRLFAAWSLSDLAGPELGLGRPELAARLVGAADEALRALAVTRLPGDRPGHESVVAALRETLDEAEFERLRAEGARLSLEEAVTLALSRPAPVRLPAPREPVRVPSRTRR